MFAVLNDPFSPFEPFTLGKLPLGKTLAQQVRALFANGEKGVWYDPSDLTSMFQDSAGTTAAVVGQPVGLVLDKSGNGYHATQSTSTARPILARHPIGGRRNLLTYTEDFGNAAWLKERLSAVGTALTPSVDLNTHNLIRSMAKDASASTYSISGKATENGYSYLLFRVDSGGGNGVKIGINLLTGEVSNAFALNGVGWVLGASSVALNAAGECVFSISFTTDALTVIRTIAVVSDIAGDAFAPASFAGNGTSGINLLQYQIELGSTPTAYQKVVSTYDVTEAGVNDAYYLKFDGVDDFLVTPSIDFSGTDKMTVVAGVRKLSDAATGLLVELSSGILLANGAFNIQAPGATGVNGYLLNSKGTAQAVASATGQELLSVISANMGIATDTASLRINGAQAASSTTDQGTGNYGNHPLYIGMRAGTSLPLNGHLYSLIVRGALSDAAQIASAESFVNSKTGAY